MNRLSTAPALSSQSHLPASRSDMTVPFTRKRGRRITARPVIITSRAERSPDEMDLCNDEEKEEEGKMVRIECTTTHNEKGEVENHMQGVVVTATTATTEGKKHDGDGRGTEMEGVEINGESGSGSGAEADESVMQGVERSLDGGSERESKREGDLKMEGLE